MTKQEMAELTGEQLTEKFFTEVKGWEWKLPDGWKHGSSHAWVGPSGRLASGEIELPTLHTSLDLQEEWLWPELIKIRHFGIEFYWYEDEKLWFASFDNSYTPGAYTGTTKALAQLEAGLKALGML